ncbi:MAG: hypothetical protein HOI80_01110 [Alphaproteobacteria bacterium]|jgi:hypothetical protein|nr:hypothetical protein [Alphaproteobacteria bacterium]MBT5390411.1 hypothetical protein [Alphaproteobacteria bacterium]MBT5654085.1 hypothetical protein [Alphaproteobacteria bacterium]
MAMEEVKKILEETGLAHHKAFIEAGGVDPDWSQWYANHALKPLNKALETDFTDQKLAEIFRDAAQDHDEEAPDIPWEVHYSLYLWQHIHQEEE